MGGEGSMLSANISLRNNRNLLKSKRFSKNRDALLSTKENSTTQFKKVNPEELNRIKAEIRNKEFLKMNYPRGRAIEVFRSFYFAHWVKKRNSVFRFPSLRE